MKKTILTILCGIILIGLTGCDDSSKKDFNDIHTFEGTIIECDQKSMIVHPNESEKEFKSSDKFRIQYVNSFSSCNIGEKVKITYEGMINESYPAQIGTTKIEIKSEENSNENVKPVKMKVLLDNKNFEVKKQEKIKDIYQQLSNLKYEASEDQSLENAILIYFYDQDDNMISMFAIYENYLKLNGMPDTYKIIDNNFNYDNLVDNIESLI